MLQFKINTRRGHTLVELMAALVSSAMLMAGLGSVMLIARQIAYAPAASNKRVNASEAINELSDEVRFATFLVAHSTHLLEFVVTDRDGDGSAERIRYEWSGVSGDPLMKTFNGGTSFAALDSVQDFQSNISTINQTTAIGAYSLTRYYVSRVDLVLQSASATHGRINASVQPVNAPELLSAYWRTDFDSSPTAIDVTRDGVADWAITGGGSFNPGNLAGGVWQANGALETRPLNDFVTPTTVEVCCRNTTVGGNGAVVQINADRQSGLHAPLFVQLQLQADSSQTLTLFRKSNDATNVSLFQRKNLVSDFVRVRLTILPQNNVVNLQINDEDQGTFAYTPYAPSTNDRFMTLYASTSNAEFDYAEVRVAE